MSDKNKNILIATLEYPPFYGGVGKYYYCLKKYWPNKNIYVLADTVNKENDKFYTENNLFFAKLINKKLPILKWMSSFYQILKLKYLKKIDHIIVGHILPLGIVVYFLSFFMNIEYTIVMHGMDFTFALRTKRKEKLLNRILNRANNIVCANSYLANLVENRYDYLKQKISIINPGIEVMNFDIGLKIQELCDKYDLQNKKIIFSLSRLVSRKGIDRAIEAIHMISDEIENVFYFIAGTGKNEEDFKELAKHNKNIIFLGEIDDDEKWSWFSLCDVFLMPSRKIDDDFEGFGIVYLEANLLGKPVVAGKNGGVSDAVEDGVNGLLVNPESVDDIADKILLLLKNNYLRESLGENGRKRAIEKFDWKKQTEKFYNIIN